MEQLYKIVAADGSACHGGSGKWILPIKGYFDKTFTPLDF